MSRYELMLLVHVAGAFAVVAGFVLLGSTVLAASRARRPSEVALLLGLARVNAVLFSAGGLVIIVFGILLALDLDSYSITDAWIVAAIVLWFVIGFAGARAGAAYGAVQQDAQRLAREGDSPSAELVQRVRDRRAASLLALGAAALLATLVLMIFKPGV